MDEITKSYIIDYYYRLLTPREKTAYVTMVAEHKVAFHKEWMAKVAKMYGKDEAKMLALYPSEWEQAISTDPQVRALLANGREAFLTSSPTKPDGCRWRSSFSGTSPVEDEKKSPALT